MWLAGTIIAVPNIHTQLLGIMMTAIAATAAGTGFISSSQSDSTAQQTDPDTSTTAADEVPLAASVSAVNVDTVEISTRAQKIQMLNEEFFPSGPGDVVISAELIERLEEYGFLSTSEAENLSSISVAGNESNEGASTVGELSIFIDSFVDTVEKIEPESSIIGVLRHAQTVISSFNEPTIDSRAINIPNIVEQLQSYRSTVTDRLPNADKESLNQLVLALNIANSLSPGTNTTTEINQYLAISNF